MDVGTTYIVQVVRGLQVPAWRSCLLSSAQDLGPATGRWAECGWDQLRSPEEAARGGNQRRRPEEADTGNGQRRRPEEAAREYSALFVSPSTRPSLFDRVLVCIRYLCAVASFCTCLTFQFYFIDVTGPAWRARGHHGVCGSPCRMRAGGQADTEGTPRNVGVNLYY